MALTFQYCKYYQWCKEPRMRVNSQYLPREVSMTILCKKIRILNFYELIKQKNILDRTKTEINVPRIKRNKNPFILVDQLKLEADHSFI